MPLTEKQVLDRLEKFIIPQDQLTEEQRAAWDAAVQDFFRTGLGYFKMVKEPIAE